MPASHTIGVREAPAFGASAGESSPARLLSCIRHGIILGGEKGAKLSQHGKDRQSARETGDGGGRRGLAGRASGERRRAVASRVRWAILSLLFVGPACAAEPATGFQPDRKVRQGTS